MEKGIPTRIIKSWIRAATWCKIPKMPPSTQTIIAIAIAGLALTYLLWSSFRKSGKGKCGCGTTCVNKPKMGAHTLKAVPPAPINQAQDGQ